MSKIAKAIVGGVTGAITAIGTGIITAAQSDGISGDEKWTIIGGALVALSAGFGLVWATPNTP